MVPLRKVRVSWGVFVQLVRWAHQGCQRDRESHVSQGKFDGNLAANLAQKGVIARLGARPPTQHH